MSVTRQAAKSSTGDMSTTTTMSTGTTPSTSESSMVPREPTVTDATPTNVIDDKQFHDLFNSLLERVETLTTEVQKLRTKIPEANVPIKQEDEKITKSVDIVEAPLVSAPLAPEPIVSIPKSEAAHLRTLYGKFSPTKISPKFVEQSIDQLESWLDINGVKGDHDRFLLLKMSIEPETYREVSTVLATAHPGHEFETLKSAIIKTFTDTESKRIQNLLSGIHLGDRRPSQLLAEMCNLYKGTKDKIFEELFLSRLPGNVRGILVSMRNKDGEPKSIETIAQWADSIIEQLNVPAMIGTIAPEINMVSLQTKLDNMSEKINAFTQHSSDTRFRPPFKRRSYSKNNNQDDGNEPRGSFICYFHKKFGNNRHENTRCSLNCKLNKTWREVRAKQQQKN